jgi:hypothetical protein
LGLIHNKTTSLLDEEFDDIKGVTRIRKAKKDISKKSLKIPNG